VSGISSANKPFTVVGYLIGTQLLYIDRNHKLVLDKEYKDITQYHYYYFLLQRNGIVYKILNAVDKMVGI